jgi:chemotaxis protein MotB
LSSAVLFNREEPLNPANRRISMIVMNKRAEEAAQHDGGEIKTDAEMDSESLGEEGKPSMEAIPAVVEGSPLTHAAPAAH